MPGHTLGQIAYYFQREEALFTGDTLFSAGCGRLFEGTPEQMFHSLQKIRRLPPATKIYFGHEYTLRNLDFVLSRTPDPVIRSYREQVAARIAKGEDSTPSSLETELAINPFLNASTIGEFTEIREARNHW
jgi:hydroxyacylglutathione hydrolase